MTGNSKVITAVVIGGASLSGVVGCILGTSLDVLFLAIVYDAFAMTGISTYWQDVVIGAMLRRGLPERVSQAASNQTLGRSA